MNIFFDTSVLVKLFHRETGSLEVESLFSDNTISISELAIAEFYSATLRKFREKAITEQQVREILSAFDDQLAFFIIEPLRRAVIDESKVIIRKGEKSFLYALSMRFNWQPIRLLRVLLGHLHALTLNCLPLHVQWGSVQ